MNIYNILEKKKNKFSLTDEEIKYVVDNYTNGVIPDYQMSALLMAICINGMTDEEIFSLTKHMTNSGSKMDLSMFDKTVDKHSTGGVGDKTTLIVGPIVACLNCKVAKMSGRALGYTGGTIDKLESIAGFKTKLSTDEFISQINNINIALISQTENVAPADKKIYALRDVTATVESIPLIASSIMSKKIASGAKNLVIDVKVGSGAFMKNKDDAALLADKMVKIGKNSGINTIAVLTNMDIPLGNNIGNALEVQEALAVLNNEGPKDLKDVCIVLAAIMNAITNNIPYNESVKQVISVLETKQAYNKFLELVKLQGGDINSVFDTPIYKYEVFAKQEGYISSMNTESIGKVSGLLGAGRMTKDDKIDYTAGIILNKKTGDRVNSGELLATFYSSKVSEFNNIEKQYLDSITISNTKPEINLILGLVGNLK